MDQLQRNQLYVEHVKRFSDAINQACNSSKPIFHLFNISLLYIAISKIVFLSLVASRSFWENVEYKLRCINYRRVSDSRRAFWLAFRVTGISDDLNRSPLAVIVISLGKPRSARENIRCIWEYLGAPPTTLVVPVTFLEASTTSLGAL